MFNIRLPWVAPLLALAATAALAQGAAGYPAKPVRLIIPYAPGGGVNTATRVFGDKLAADLGQPFLIDNRPGGNSTIATQAVARAAPDGYTLLVSTATIAVNASTQANLPYDTLKELVGVSTLIRNDHMIAVHPSLPANNLRELIAYARQNPGKVDAIVVGLGTNSHINQLLIMQATGMQFNLVPYKSSGTAMTDLLAGTVQLSVSTPSNLIPLIKSGKLKGIAVSGEKRNAQLPDLPTFAESGLKDFMAGTWYMMLAPAATPRDVVEKLNAATSRAQNAKDLQDALAKLGIDPFPASVAATNAFLRSEMANVAKVVKEYDFKAAAED